MKLIPVVVIWEDITKNTNDNNFDETVSPDTRLTVMTSVGYLYQETDRTILLVQEFWTNEGKHVPRDWLVIPRGNIVSVKKL
jgi:hypothetical protein